MFVWKLRIFNNDKVQTVWTIYKSIFNSAHDMTLILYSDFKSEFT